jgi:hypothetical protein
MVAGRLLTWLPRPRGRASLVRACVADARLTLETSALALPAMAGIAIASIAAPMTALGRGVLPAAFVALGLVLADVPTRDRTAGVEALLFSAPGLRSGFVPWKLGGCLLVSLGFLAVAGVRVALDSPRAALSLAVGSLLACAGATALGVLLGNPKAFVALFLTFLYLAADGGARTPALDFAGFHRTATPGVTAVYGSIAAALVAVAGVAHAARLRRV